MPDIFIGRQAIYDHQLRLFGYELLYREGEGPLSGPLDGDKASSSVLLNTFMEMGLERIVGPHHAFINLTRHFFVEMPPLPFTSDKVVLELLEDIPVDDLLVERVDELHQAGYQLALDDFVFEEKWLPLLPYASIIKVEVPAVDWSELEEEVRGLRRHPVKLLAEKVETREEFDRLQELDFDLYQGFFFSRPTLISGRTVQQNHVVVLRLLARLNDPEVPIAELERIIGQDAGLSYKILRFINSPAVGLPRKVEAIREAVVYMGLTRIRAWASLLALSGIEGKPDELMNKALLRANLCELLIRETGSASTDTAFTVGLLSILDLLMDQRLEDILSELPLADEAQQALLQHSGPLGEALACALAYDNLDWGNTRFADLPHERLNLLYLQASETAFRTVTGLTDD